MRSKLILVLALVMGLITTMLFFNYMKQFDEAKAVNETTVEVVVAKSKISENVQITSAMLEMKSVPKDAVHSQTLKSVGEAAGKIAKSDIETGEMVLSSRLADQQKEDIFVSRKVQEGYRAVSVGADFVRSVSNLIEPEDFVDVIFTEVVKVSGEEDKIETEIILDRVRVLAVGRYMVESTEDEDEHEEYSSVTLELTDKETIKLVNASERGYIHLAMHSRVNRTSEKDSE
ncbi:Flp pilus assembly protein CpaB [Thalassobacillus hwangdonensis]|uniref:Flp pilus assembly protein CpaB n=1 Tax=Thalassobacillus hwangdonensis TaxID=546108 RepID=A0ABW3L1I8_9BACI